MNSRLAQELGVWAETQTGGEAIHDALYKAYFVDNRNLHDVDVLLDIVESLGLPRAEAEKVLTERTYKDAVDADWAKSRQYGVTGVPTFVAGQRGVVGQELEGPARLIKLADFSTNALRLQRVSDPGRRARLAAKYLHNCSSPSTPTNWLPSETAP